MTRQERHRRCRQRPIPMQPIGAAIERADLGRRVTRRWRNTLGTLVYLARRYGRLELSSSGEKNSAETLPVNENNLLLMGPEQRRSRS